MTRSDSPFVRGLVSLGRFSLGVLLAVGAISPLAAATTAAPRQVVSFDHGWKFHLGDAPGAEQPGFADTGWRALDLPHDWMIEGVPGVDPSRMEGPFDPKSPGGENCGYLNGGVGWYRKTFTLPEAAPNERVSILFDGAYMDADVYLNGQKLGNHPYGFTSFFYDLTPGLIPGANVVAVRLNVEQPSCRWYSGAGLYRHVWLVLTQPVHVATWGVDITTPQISALSAKVHVDTRIDNAGTKAGDGVLTTVLLDPAGRETGRLSSPFNSRPGAVPADAGTVVGQDIVVARPQIWSPETPALYRAVSEVRLNAEVVDSVSTRFGMRTIEFTKEGGFLLNGQRVQIRGVCDHHDLGCLGSVALRRGFQRQLEMLRTMGCNALRTSHNPPSPELLDLCDEMGFLVMDECFDEWKQNKKPRGYGRFFDEWSEQDLVSMIHRDRNHPCIILWSIGNEIPESATAACLKLGPPLAAICHREDPTRPVTAACQAPGASLNVGFDKVLDVFGINYKEAFYQKPEARAHVPLVGSETASSVDSRGEYGLSLDAGGTLQVQQKPDQQTHQMSCYDLWQPPWATNAEAEEVDLQNAPWVAGEFVWTGFDYIGEPTPYSWPSRSSYFGALDLCGFPKDRYYMYQSQWTAKPMVHILPHWSWPGFEGKPIPVRVYSNADAVELFVNGRSLGAKKMSADAENVPNFTPGEHGQVKALGDLPSVHVAWSVPYAPGELKAVATKAGQTVATETIRTAGPPARLTLSADRTTLLGNGEDLSFVKVAIVDQHGNVCPNARNKIHFTLAGDAASLAGVDDGDATNHESFRGTQHQAYHGLALAVLRSHDGSPGDVTLSATADGLAPATVRVSVQPAR